MENLFCEPFKQLQLVFALMTPEQYKDTLSKVQTLILSIYESNETDVEDLGDCLTLIQITLSDVIQNKKYPDTAVAALLDLRMCAKKLLNKKYREGTGKCKENEQPRTFWNVEECEVAYRDALIYIWKPFVEELKQTIPRSRPHITISAEKKPLEMV